MNTSHWNDLEAKSSWPTPWGSAPNMWQLMWLYNVFICTKPPSLKVVTLIGSLEVLTKLTGDQVSSSQKTPEVFLSKQREKKTFCLVLLSPANLWFTAIGSLQYSIKYKKWWHFTQLNASTLLMMELNYYSFETSSSTSNQNWKYGALPPHGLL